MASAPDANQKNTYTHKTHMYVSAVTANKETYAHTGGGGGGGGYENDSDDDSDAGPIEITKQASKDGGQEGEGEGEGEGDAGDGAFDIEPPVPGEGGGGGGGKKTGVKHEGGGDGVANSKAEGGVSSSELRAQRGREDRPVFDMFSAAALPAAGGPGGKMGGKGGNGGAHGMSFLGEDGGGDQVRLLLPCFRVIGFGGGVRFCCGSCQSVSARSCRRRVLTFSFDVSSLCFTSTHLPAFAPFVAARWLCFLALFCCVLAFLSILLVLLSLSLSLSLSVSLSLAL